MERYNFSCFPTPNDLNSFVFIQSQFDSQRQATIEEHRAKALLYRTWLQQRGKA